MAWTGDKYRGRYSVAAGRRFRWAIYARDGFQCVYCGSTEDLELDHKTPNHRYRGKYHPDHHTNLLTACRSCNASKGAKNLPEYLAWLGQMDKYNSIRSKAVRELLPSHYVRGEIEYQVRRRLDAAVKQEIDRQVRDGLLCVPEQIDDEDIPF